MNRRKAFLFALLAVSLAVNLVAQEISETELKIDYKIRNTADYVGNKYITAWGQHPSVLTFVNSDGSVTVCASNTATTNSTYTKNIIINNDNSTTYIYEYDINLQEQKTLTVPNEIGDLGAFTKDNDGNYYFFFADETTDKNKENMAMVKYDSEGNKIKTYKLKSNATDSFDGIKKPFEAGTCRLELSGNMLAVYFARLMYSGHQASYGFILDKDTFERIDLGAATNDDKIAGDINMIMPYTSHSFNQFILPIENGFVFADHGDAYPRSFTFAKFQKEKMTRRVHAFVFTGSKGSNPTYAELGGLSKTSSGYIFTGTYGEDRNKARNLFVLTFDENMNKCSAPIYLTKYTTKDGHAGHPKIVEIKNNRYLLLWEFFKFSTQYANEISGGVSEYISTYMLIIDEKGKALTEPKELKGIRLSMNETLRYNPHNGKVYWAINEGNNAIKIYALESE